MLSGTNLRAVALFLVLTACAGAVVVDVGCATYGDLRASMPPLGMSALDEWVARLDSAMTGACRG
ncbi:MAG: hypothetical protein ACRC14_02625 [Paracoccaceae bacterium]